MNHILDTEQFSQKELSQLFLSADKFRENDKNIDKKREARERHLGRVVASIFYEPSTRTRMSFEIAAGKLGMHVVSTENAAEFSSAAKGESIEDTVQVLNEYGVDAIVLRSKEEGYAERAAKVSEAAIINAGDGKGEHPTQAALDVYTIRESIGRLHHMNVVIGGDLARGRTARSLAQLVSKYPENKITFVSSPELQIGSDIKARLKENHTPYEETTDMLGALREADVVYWTRLQLERGDKTRPQVDQSHFVLDEATLKVLPKHAIIMHPLPRNQEIAKGVDHDPRAKYFRQAGNGLYIRMAMLDMIMRQQS